MSAETILANYLSFIGQVLVANKIQPGLVNQLLVTDGQYEFIRALVVLEGGDVYAIIDGKHDPIPQYKRTSVFSTFYVEKWDELCGVEIADMAHSPYYYVTEGEPHVLLVTSSGTLYSWGNNAYGQLGVDDDLKFSHVPLIVIGDIQEKKVKQVACGDEISACLTTDGQVWTWGDNDSGRLGNGTMTADDKCLVPSRVSFPPDGDNERVIQSICCGLQFMLALDEAGKVWAWGSNSEGEVGCNSAAWIIERPERCLIPEDVAIKQIECGPNYALALSADGQIWSWGCNTVGQLGLGEQIPSANTPRRVPAVMEKTPDVAPTDGDSAAEAVEKENMTEAGDAGNSREVFFEEIAAHPSVDLSAARGSDGKVYIWGECGSDFVFSPQKTSITDLGAAFLFYSNPQVSFGCIHVDCGKTLAAAEAAKALLKSFEDSFDDPNTADLKFIVDGKTIHVHKTILKIRSKHFATMLADEGTWKESNSPTIDINGFSYPVFKAYNQYLYTGRLSEDLGAETLIELVDLAQSYLEDELRALCVEKIKNEYTSTSIGAPREVSVKKATTIYARAIMCAAKDVEQALLDFIVTYLTAVVKSGTLDQLDKAALLVVYEEAESRKADVLKDEASA